MGGWGRSFCSVWSSLLLCLGNGKCQTAPWPSSTEALLTSWLDAYPITRTHMCTHAHTFTSHVCTCEHTIHVNMHACTCACTHEAMCPYTYHSAILWHVLKLLCTEIIIPRPGMFWTCPLSCTTGEASAHELHVASVRQAITPPSEMCPA